MKKSPFKEWFFLCLVLLGATCLVPLAGLSLGEEAEIKIRPKGEIRDAATHEDLSKALLQSLRNSPVKALKPSQGQDPSKAKVPKDLISQSDIICYRGAATLVPKRAVIHVPEALEDRLEMKDDARVYTWTNFYAANRAWIAVVEVDFEQAKGESPLPEKTLEWIQNSNKLVVATLKGGPISVLPPKEAEPDTASADTTDN